ncbi:MAG: glycosyl hydrolase family 18 protein [Lachnospiraceae bacterium]
MSIYVVKPGNDVDGIEQQFGVPVGQIIADNQLVYPYKLAVGQSLLIMDGQEMGSGRLIRSNGYAYPFISRWVLEQTLPYLSELSVFSYGFTEEGELVEPFTDDRWMVEAALQFGTRPILTLTPLGPDGRFDNRLISAVVRNTDSRDRLIENLLAVMQEKGYQGLDIDFEYILAEDRDLFTAFVQACADAMHMAGYTLSVALAPKTSADQPGLLYAGKDYRALGAAADSVLLMTYEWGYTYGPPMAVAPLNKVRQVVEYAVTEIPTEKISLGIPNYGYDWPLPFVRGSTKAKTIGNVEAVQLAVAYGAIIRFDEVAGSPYFHYTDTMGSAHEVWFEDVRSLQGKFDLIDEFGLRGPGYWQIMQLFRANWLLLAERFGILKNE